MNWVGGTRNRIRTQNEKKMQREFFERKKFADKVHIFRSISSSGIRKHGLGQDFRAFQTVDIAHSKQKGNEPSRSVKKVDLDVSKSSSILRMVEDIDLGPASPSLSISKINLMEPKYEKKKQVSDYSSGCFKKESSFDASYKSSVPKFEPYASPNPYIFKKPQPQFKSKITNIEEMAKKFEHKDMEPETPILPSFHEYKPANPDSLKPFTFSENHVQLADLCTSSPFKSQTKNSKKLQNCSDGNMCDIHGKINVLKSISTDTTATSNSVSRNIYKRPCDNRNEDEQKHPSPKGLYVSEDFQLTPLTKYQKATSPYKSKNQKDIRKIKNNVSFPSPIGRVFCSEDFIQTPMKKSRYFLSQSSSVLYPKTSTPTQEALPRKLSPDNSMLLKKLPTPDFKEDNNDLTETTNFNGSIKEFYYMKPLKEMPTFFKNSIIERPTENFDHFSPLEGSIFPVNLLQEVKNKKILNESPNIRIKLPRSSENPCQVSTKNEVDQVNFTESQINKRKLTKTDSQMEEILAELTELENQDCPAEISEDIQLCEKNMNDCEENKTWKQFTYESKAETGTEIINADKRQELVNRNVVSKVLNEMISTVEKRMNSELVDCDVPHNSPYNTALSVTNSSKEYSGDDELRLTPTNQFQTVASIKTNMCTSATQTVSKLYVDSSTSPMIVTSFEKINKCSLSKEVSPQLHSNDSKFDEISVKPILVCPAVCLDKLENEVFIDIKQEVESDTYCLRSRKTS